MTTVGAPGVSSAMRSSPFVPIVALAALGLLALPARARSVALRVLDASDAPAPAAPEPPQGVIASVRIGSRLRGSHATLLACSITDVAGSMRIGSRPGRTRRVS